MYVICTYIYIHMCICTFLYMCTCRGKSHCESCLTKTRDDMWPYIYEILLSQRQTPNNLSQLVQKYTWWYLCPLESPPHPTSPKLRDSLIRAHHIIYELPLILESIVDPQLHYTVSARTSLLFAVQQLLLAAKLAIFGHRTSILWWCLRTRLHHPSPCGIVLITTYMTINHSTSLYIMFSCVTSNCAWSNSSHSSEVFAMTTFLPVTASTIIIKGSSLSKKTWDSAPSLMWCPMANATTVSSAKRKVSSMNSACSSSDSRP